MPSAMEPDLLGPSRSQKRQLTFVAVGFLSLLGTLFTLWPKEVFSKAYLPHLYQRRAWRRRKKLRDLAGQKRY
jgi:hypothetical protein